MIDLRFQRALAFTLGEEGGDVDNPHDPGGLTSRGITQTTWLDWLAAKGIAPRLVTTATDDEVASLYEDIFWNHSQAYRLPIPLDMAFFDSCVAFGNVWATVILQALVGVKRDGILGPVTLAAIDAHDAKDLTISIIAARAGYHLCRGRYFPDAHHFVTGWLARCQRLMRAREEAT